MDLFIEGFKEAYYLILQPTAQVWMPVLRTLQVTGAAIAITILIGLPIGLYIGLGKFKGRQTLLTTINAAMGLPPVVAGFFVSIILWRSGIFGSLGLMYTPFAMVVAEVIIALPLVIGLTASAVQSLDKKYKWQIEALGASKVAMAKKILTETRIAVAAAIIAGFGGIISEVGAAMMVGGNIEGQTRVLTTAIVFETRLGRFENAIALSFILLVLALVINIALTRVQQKDGIRWNRSLG